MAAIRCSRTARRLCLSRASRLSIDTWTKCPCLYFPEHSPSANTGLDQAITQISRRFRPAAHTSISHERLVFTQSDMRVSNFGVDDKGMTCLFDFGEVGCSLLAQPFWCSGHWLTSTAWRTLSLSSYFSSHFSLCMRIPSYSLHFPWFDDFWLHSATYALTQEV
jgi:hypothetical protein